VGSLDRLRDSVCSIVRCVAFMKRILSHTVAALAAGLCLRLFFVFKFPFATGDTALYEQLATNWLQHHVYAVTVDGALVPTDLRVPGFPGFLAVIYAIARRVGEDARFYVRLAQVAVDLVACLSMAGLAGLLGSLRPDPGSWRRAFVVTLWLAALCPFTANYTAVPMTEVWAVFLTAAALLSLVALIGTEWAGRASIFVGLTIERHAGAIFVFAGGFFIGMGTLFRPETPLLLVVAWMVIGFFWLRKRWFGSCVRVLAWSAIGCALPLAPWAVRNAVTLHEVQFLAPKNSNMPGEVVPYGFMAWEKTWIFRLKDCYVVPWKLDGDVINLDDIPARAFDTQDEKDRVAALLEQYNNDLTINTAEDAAFGQLARERTARHPLRTYVWLPVARAFTMWFTPRIELLPFSAQVFPVREAWREDPIDFSVSVGFCLLSVLYVALAIWGSIRLWKEGPTLVPAVALLLGYILVRTAFLTTLETPEPRYVLECFPAVLALAGQVFARSLKQPDLAQR
jgi:hypothetical protein